MHKQKPDEWSYMQLKRSGTGKKAVKKQSLGWKKICTRDIAEKSEPSKPRKHADM